MPDENRTRADDDVCLCFHVSKRKIVNFIRVEKPVRVSQISQCLSAGTGCGWCRPVLEKLFETAATARGDSMLPGSDPENPQSPLQNDGFSDLSPDDYANQRKTHIARQRQTARAHERNDDRNDDETGPARHPLTGPESPTLPQGRE